MHESITPSRTACIGAEFPMPNLAGDAASARKPDAGCEVGESRPSGQGLSDADREAAILRAGIAIERHEGIWLSTGCFAARGDADRARRLMEQLIAGRSPEQRARMLAAQAERMAREPGAEKV